MGTSKQDVLDQQLLAFAEQALPSADSEIVYAKLNVWHRLQQVAQRVLGESVQAIPFGSSANCCGEASADIDFVLYVPPTPEHIPAKKRLLKKKNVQQALAIIHRNCLSNGFSLQRRVLQARIPLITLIDKRSNCICDVTIQEPLPLFNTCLLQTYAHLEPYLIVLSITVKRWAKAADIAKTRYGFISSYSWTLLVIYYLQVCHGLPSAHAVLQEQGGDRCGEFPYQCVFADVAQCRSRYRPRTTSMCVGTLLKGFFSFYAQEFDWRDEVVSVRLGRRTHFLHEGSWNTFDPYFLAKPNCGSLHIEDPVECRRNLNYAVQREGLEKIKAALREADLALQSGALLPLVLADKPPAQSWLRSPREMLARCLDGYLKASRKDLQGKCQICGTVMPFDVLLNHREQCQGEGFRGR